MMDRITEADELLVSEREADQQEGKMLLMVARELKRWIKERNIIFEHYQHIAQRVVFTLRMPDYSEVKAAKQSATRINKDTGVSVFDREIFLDILLGKAQVQPLEYARVNVVCEFLKGEIDRAINGDVSRMLPLS